MILEEQMDFLVSVVVLRAPVKGAGWSVGCQQEFQMREGLEILSLMLLPLTELTTLV